MGLELVVVVVVRVVEVDDVEVELGRFRIWPREPPVRALLRVCFVLLRVCLVVC